jgi:lactate permease
MCGARYGFCTPKEVWTFGATSKWEKDWFGDIIFDGHDELKPRMSQLMAWLPYIFIAVILVLTRIDILPLKDIFNRYGVINFSDIFGYKGVNENSIKLLYLPGTVPFMLIAILTIFMHRMPMGKVAQAWIETFSTIKAATISLCASVALVKIFQGSGDFTNPDLIAQLAANGVDTQILSMPRAMAEAIAGIVGPIWPLFASYVGGLGAFITGSNTVSDILFAQFQWDVAELQKLSRMVILAAQGAGGAMGNMICVHNIVAVCAVLGLSNREGDILKKTFWPFLLYGAVVGIVTYILIAIGYSSF